MLITYPHVHYLSVWVPLAAGSLSARRPRVLITYPHAHYLSVWVPLGVAPPACRWQSLGKPKPNPSSPRRPRVPITYPCGSSSARRPRVLVTYPPAYFLSANRGCRSDAKAHRTVSRGASIVTGTRERVSLVPRPE